MNCTRIKILIIDDEKPILIMLQKIFDRIGVVVEMADTAKEGINKINSNSYALIMTDIKMPGMSGDDVFKYVRTNVSKSIPIIAMSGTPWLLENSSFDAVLAKPFHKEDCLNLIRLFVDPSYSIGLPIPIHKKTTLRSQRERFVKSISRTLSIKDFLSDFDKKIGCINISGMKTIITHLKFIMVRNRVLISDYNGFRGFDNYLELLE